MHRVGGLIDRRKEDGYEVLVEERLALLRRVLLHSYEMTMKDLLEAGRIVARDTVDAYNDLLLELHTTERNPL